MIGAGEDRGNARPNKPEGSSRRAQKVLTLAKELDSVSYYELLGISETATAREIIEKYYLLATKLHPDRFVREGDAKQLEALNRIGARLGEAKAILSDQKTRSSYDSGLKKGMLRLLPEERETKTKSLSQDPEHPLARQLYLQAQKLIAGGDEGTARSKLALARQYQRDSVAIAELLASVTEPAKAPETAEAEAAFEGPPARLDPREQREMSIKLKLGTWKRVERLMKVEISRGGMFLPTTKVLPIGARLTLDCLLPNQEKIQLPCEIVGGGRGDKQGFAVQFLPMSADVEQKIKEVVSKRQTQKIPPAVPNEQAAATTKASLRESKKAARPTVKARKILCAPILVSLLGTREDAVAFIEKLNKHEYGDAIGRLLEVVDDASKQKYLRAVTHLVEGMQASASGDKSSAALHYKKVLQYDPVCFEAIRALRKKP